MSTNDFFDDIAGLSEWWPLLASIGAVILIYHLWKQERDIAALKTDMERLKNKK